MQKSYDPWPGPDEHAVIDAMLADLDSYHWGKCSDLVASLTHQWVQDLSFDDRLEVIQNVMAKVVQYLPKFKRKCKLSTWLVRLVRSCRADEFRKLPPHSIQIESLSASRNNDDDKAENNDPSMFMTAEEEYLLKEEWDEIHKSFLKYLAIHGNRERKKEILDLFLSGYNYQEIAKKLGMRAANVGYFIRSMVEFARGDIQR